MVSIGIKNVSKFYTFYPSRLRFIAQTLFSLGKKEDLQRHAALAGINLDIQKGQCVGFIGRNGSGKSTLLRLIAGIVHPSDGSIRTNGRLSTVLDITSGFNPKLTGMQNIFFKGKIHGLKTHQIKSLLPVIIEFSGLEQYIDYPINTYSTGMIIRLGFSIAMHVDFDILLMDEILSVGDIVFQRQCLAKIRDFIKQGKTIVIASHNLSDVAAVCSRVVLLQNGVIQYDGETEQVLKHYWERCKKDSNKIPRHLHPLSSGAIYGTDTKEITISDVHFTDRNGNEKKAYCTGDYMAIAIRFNAVEPVDNPLFRVQFFRNEGLLIHGANTARTGFSSGRLSGEGQIQLEFECLNFLEGEYFVSVGIWPDEFTSAFTDLAYDFHQWDYIIRIRSRREDGGGIVSNRFSWKLTHNNGKHITDKQKEQGKCYA